VDHDSIVGSARSLAGRHVVARDPPLGFGAEAERRIDVIRTRVESTSITEVGYDAETCTMEVAFVNGRVYRYFDVPVHVHAALMKADSIGAMFNREVRGVYRYARA
jgi:hypothetical protein